MIKKITRPLTIITLIGVLFSITVLSASLFDKPQEQTSQNVSQNGRFKTLRDVAQERDVETESTSCLGEFSGLASLTKASNTIVVGTIIDTKSYFSEDGHTISTTYTIHTERILKSEGPISAPFEFVGFGGIVEVNGHRAVYKKKSFDQLIKGKRHVFFLQWMPKYKMYFLSGGEVSGVFTVDDNSNVKSLASDSNSELHVKHSGINLETFHSKVIANR
jgi:hypothetical protein